MKQLVAAAGTALLCACSMVRLPQTLGEQAANYGYVPLDGLSVKSDYGDSCGDTPAGRTLVFVPLLQSLPDISVRFSVQDFEPNGSLSFGPAKITTKDQIYRAVLDYVNVDSLPQTFWIRSIVGKRGGGTRYDSVPPKLSDGESVLAYEAHLEPDNRVSPLNTSSASAPVIDKQKQRNAFLQSILGTGSVEGISKLLPDSGYTEITIPVYVGIGMRLTADVRALEGGVALSSLDSIGLSAEAKSLTGTLTVQTLGITGKSIATSLPLPNKLDQTTVENGILALATSRASIYSAQDDSSDVTRTPRIVGLYSPIGTSAALINVLYSELSKVRLVWFRPCANPTSDKPSKPTSAPIVPPPPGR
jgi:hypothetical protein